LLSQDHTPKRQDKPITLTLTLADIADVAALGPRWRALESRAEGSFFQSWSWLGCLAAERFPHAKLLVARRDGQDIALALLNRGRSRLAPITLWLGESGIPRFDSTYVEHNGVLVAQEAHGRDQDLITACLRAVLAESGVTRLVLSGVDDAHLQAAQHTGAAMRPVKTQPAPFVALASPEISFLDGLSANTRYQLRRSARRFEMRGPLKLHRAGTVAEARVVLDELALLHQATWTKRGRPGAFANPNFLRFHHALIDEALPRGEIDLLRITAGPDLIGCLYNFRHRGHVLAYQSGFDYAPSHSHEKPGLTCHHLAIEAARANGLTRYDFLAGEDRYKASLAQDATQLHWIDLAPRWSMRGMATRAQAMFEKTHAFCTS
jgi:CelD/BcsL family acetyltransferase involved in cellulose biosynthesis